MGDAVSRKLFQAAASSARPASLSTIMSSAPLVTIPVVFHIVNSSPATITDAQIFALLDTLNKDFGGNNGDSVKILPGFKPYFGKSNIRFCLAQRTPGGAATGGIMRYVSSTISSASSSNDPIKSSTLGGADAWDPARYFNVWIGTFSSSSLLGYAAFPITSPENPAGLLSQQGVVIETGTIPGGSRVGYNNGRILTHEAGHFFWLRHIWGDAACGNDFPNTPGIDDTPLASGPSSGCGVGIVPTGCTGSFPNGRMYQNYMDYSRGDCIAMFSIGQTIRMQVALDSFRAGLKLSNGCEPVTCPSFAINIANPSAGTVSVSVSGGQMPYTYSLDGIYYQTSNQFNNLVAGNTYTVYVRDALFCGGQAQFSPNNISVTGLQSSSLCGGEPLAVNFVVSSPFSAGNVFTAQLSDSSGNFSAPVDIGSVSNTTGGTINTVIPLNVATGSGYRIRVISSSPLVTGTPGAMNLEINDNTVLPTLSIAITKGGNPACNSDEISLTAHAVNGGSSPVFIWKKNNVQVDTGRVYTSNNLQNNDRISCSMVSSSTCAPRDTVNSNTIQMVFSSSLMPSVSISKNVTDTICSGTLVTFSAAAINGGETPAYLWRKNGISTGVTQREYSTSDLQTGDSVTCEMTSGFACATPKSVGSNKLGLYVNQSVTPSVTITSSLGVSPCAGSAVTFTATALHGGASPSFQWKKNGVNVGTNSAVYVNDALVTGDSITCVMTTNSTAVCLTANTAISNRLTMNIQNCASQLLSGNAFLKDNYIEMAVGPCGVFASSVAPPAGYHPRGVSSNLLGFVADSSKSGWTDYVGDYYLPGTPEEGFGLTINGTHYNNNQLCAFNQIPGAVTSVSSGNLEKSATWRGSVAGLSVEARTFIPSGSLYFVTEVTLKNTSSSTVNDVYYMRTVDPDQGMSTPGSSGSFSTYNSIVYQGNNACNRALVTASAFSNGSDFLGLGSIDARARVSFNAISTNRRSARDIWEGNPLYPSGTNMFSDSSIAIAFKLGNLAVNESATFSYAYILSSSELEQALATTAIDLSINGITANFGQVNDVCSGTPVPITLSNIGSYSSWTWSPSKGLDTTGGTRVLATVTEPISYTATGTGPCGTISLLVAVRPTTGLAVGNTGTISGPTTFSQGTLSASYSVTPVTNATKYLWKVPAGASINAPIDSNVIVVTFPSFAFCDSISVTPYNSCSMGAKRSLSVCATSLYTVSPGTITPVCQVATNAYLPYSATGNPTNYSIVWDSAALAAGFVNVVNAPLTSGQIVLLKPAPIPVGNYQGKITVGSGSFSSEFRNFVVPVINAPVLVPSITISANTATTICAGTPVTFTATVMNGGATPIFQWRKNGLAVGTNGSTYIDNNLASGDSITCTLTSSAGCVNPAVVSSNALRFTVTNSAITTITITSASGVNACAGNAVTFNAVGTNVGGSPVYTWKKNGIAAATGQTYITSTLANNDTITCELNSVNPCTTVVTAISNSLVMKIFTVTTPTVSGPVTINCGQSTLLSAKVTSPENVIKWYNTATGGLPIVQSDTFTVMPSATTTYYAEAGSAGGGSGKRVTSIGTTAEQIIDHDGLTGDDHGGITVSTNYIYVVGDNATGRYTKSLSDGRSFPVRDGFFSDLSNGNLWQIGNNSSNGSSFYFGSVTRLYRLTEDLVPTGTFLTLTKPVSITGSTFVAPGEGFVIIFSNGTFNRINLISGEVSTTSIPFFFSFTGSESWASYGWSEFDGTNYFVCYTASPTEISRINVVTGVVSVIQSFFNLADMASIVFEPGAERMYFHHEGSSQFGGTFETLGYVKVQTTPGVSICSSARVPVIVTVNPPTITPSVTIRSNFTGTVCSGATVIFTAQAVNGGLTPLYQWQRNGVNVATGLVYSSNSLQNGDIISCVLTSSLFCVTSQTATSAGIRMSVGSPASAPSVRITSTASGQVCAGTNIGFTAVATNAGPSLSYQWRKNGLIVGTNSATYIDNGFVSGTITCTLSTNSPCSTSVTSGSISITSTTPVEPSVSITSSAGNSVCSGGLVTFTASGINEGFSPFYQWRKNGVNIATGVSYTSASLQDADSIVCLMTSSDFCVTQPVVASNTLRMIVNAAPVASAVSNTVVCAGSTVPGIPFSGNAYQYRWTNSNPGIGLPASGIGSIPSFTAVNNSAVNINSTIVATPLSRPLGFAYVANTNNNTVSVVNISSDHVVATIPVGVSPWAVALAPDGSKLFVSNTGSPASISVINTADNRVVATIPLEGPCYSLSISPDGQQLFAPNYNDGVIAVLSTSDYGYINYISTGESILSTIATTDKLYTVSSNYVLVYSYFGALLANIYVEGNAASIALSPDENILYVTNSLYNIVTAFSTITNNVVAEIATGVNPRGIALSADGRKIYTVNYGSNNVSVINTLTNEVENTIPVGNGPVAIAMSTDGTMLYVTNQTANSVSVINTTSDNAIATITGFSGPVSWGNFISSRPGCPGTPVSFTITVGVADQITWTGMADTDWHNVVNWTCGRVPLKTDRVLIARSPKSHYPVILVGDSIEVRSIKLEAGTSVTVQPGASFNLLGRE